ncbi:prolyl oligopeptidase family serine peptidase [Proteinivorax hydrogeniformans]|uniref:prolyl oligopeptidase n=1 Tax=Proteinivorax hydrogeniformans TaxID=1826727 RepID=A0AAU8HSF7_9FIRM
MKRENVKDNFFGTEVHDPYRYLENPKDPLTKKFIVEENKKTESFIKGDLHRQLTDELKEIYNFGKTSLPTITESSYFFTVNPGLQNQGVLYKMDKDSGEKKEVLDPNGLEEDGTAALTNYSISPDERYMAYTISKSGSDWQTIYIKDLSTMEHTKENLKWCKFTNMAWHPDGSGFYYSRFRNPNTVEPGEESYHNKVYFHKVGTMQQDDELIFELPQQKELSFHPFITEDKRYLILYISEGTKRSNRVYIREINSEKFIKLLDKADASYMPVATIDDTIYVRTNLGAPKERLISINLQSPMRENWQEVIGELPTKVMNDVKLVDGKFVVSYMENAHHKLETFDLEGQKLEDISLPSIGSLAGVSCKAETPELFFAFTSFFTPTTIYRYNMKTGESSQFNPPELKFDPNEFETKQVFYPSKDGTKVPMFITYKKGIKLDGNNPTVLWGYGGFNISVTPSFAPQQILWLQKGGVHAVANLRGGGELGEDWHKAGMLDNKQNVFDDFISAGEYLIEKGYTSTSKLAISGRSNGGLLVGACMTQRPDLFGAVICGVPVLDMLRFHKFTVGRYWTGEYGNAEENEEHFKFMYKYSPLHNVKDDVEYPKTLILTAEVDDRVVPAHALKFAATLKHHYKGDNPILLRVEEKAGHGMGKPIYKVIEEQADTYTFLLKALGEEEVQEHTKEEVNNDDK